MRFLTSLVYVLLLFVVPGELVILAIAHFVPFMPSLISALVLNAGVYAALFFGLRWTKFAYEDLGLHREVIHRRQRSWLEMRGCRWLSATGLIGLSFGFVILLISGSIPYPFFFLYVAIILGLQDLFKHGHLLDFPGDLPKPLFDIMNMPPGNPETCKKLTYSWIPWPDSNSESGGRYKQNFHISHTEYNQARSLKRVPTRPVANYSRYTTEEFRTSVQQIASFFRGESEEHELTSTEEMGNVVSFTRSVPYVSDTESHGIPEYANFPIETLYENGGDCEDHGILAASILHWLGHDVSLIWIELNESAHIALGYSTPDSEGPFSVIGDYGKQYFYVETVPTDSSEQLGDIPGSFMVQLRKSKVIPII